MEFKIIPGAKGSSFSQLKPILVSLCLFLALALMAQPPYNTIDGIPFNNEPRVNDTPCTMYTEPESTVEMWDWRVPRYVLNYYPGNNPPITREVDSPFYLSNNSFSPNTAFLTIGPLDFEVTEGWELLYRNFGTEENPVGEPSFGLYNRYSSLARIFFWIEPNGEEAYQEAVINVSHANVPFGEEKVSAILENLNIPANALEDFDKSALSTGQLNQVIINGTWMILEFTAYYDPCVCLHSSTLQFTPTLASVESLTFTIEGTGTSTAVYGPGSTSGSYLGTALNYANGALGSLESGYKIYKTLNEYVDDTENSNRVISILAEVLPTWFPAVGTVGKLLGFFAGKGRSTSPPTLTGFNHDFSFEGDGQILASSAYEPAAICTPGSYFDINRPPALRAIYDNPLGIFSVLETPIVEKAEEVSGTYSQTGEYDEDTYISYRFTGDLKYAINEIAGIAGSPVRLMGALVWNDCDGTDFEGPFFSTPVINLTCLEEYTIFFNFYEGAWIEHGAGGNLEYVEFPNGCYDDPELQIVAVLESSLPSYSEEILFSARYKTQVFTAPYEFNDAPENPFEGLSPEQIFDVCDPAFDQPVSENEITNFCSASYDPETDKNYTAPITTKPGTTSVKDINQNIIYPNPVRDYLTIQVPKDWDGQKVHIQLYDNLGKLVWQRDQELLLSGDYTFTNGIDKLLPGQYYLKIVGENFVNSYPLIKS